MAKMIRSFRTQMIIRLCISMGIAGGITFGLYKILQLYYKESNVQMGEPLANIRYTIAKIGDINVFLIIFIPLAILFFFLLTKSYATYFKKISSGIHQLANGDFNNRVHISTNDEFRLIAEDINKAAQELKESLHRESLAVSSKEQLIVNLAHDLRTPLTSVLGYLELLMKDQHISEDQMKHFLTIAHTKSLRLEKLIDELFEISRLNYGMLKMGKDPINIGELILQLNEEFYPSLEKSGLVTRLDMDQNLQILGDGEMLARVFENLLSNAIRYGAEGKYIDIKGYIDENVVVVEVVNYGSYIPEEELAHIFDVFYTGDRSRTINHNSTGLGLFIAKNIIEQHHGTITAFSDPIQTYFKVRIPQKS
ncbi:sensor histidine kinase [Lederbergia wuyishanensis]|uniref:histidine kinase n=1 Tax=Lederbergia wuyishanensis TaxID=1347903 RepID=A0ABU0D3K0_9BACI|nr:HAMP domain-containing sensor histidine kinase [Lederbergia wuyishanensis]MCJ8007877.1 HAMP domain-containing histidine kinase [Lederbergia wuyishanensis]MDQ0342956.1 signal transduction histidine kinase [Lederbergia wuyishanensis]